MRIERGLSNSLLWCLGSTHTQTCIDHARNIGIFDFGRSLGLTEDESLSVYAYSWEAPSGGLAPFEAVNMGLRHPLSEAAIRMTAFAATLSRALGKLPAYRGPVVRRTHLPNSHLDEAAVNGRFSEAGFLSFSKQPNLFFGSDMLVVRSTTARELGRLAAFPGESEVVYLPAAKFRVIDLSTEPTGYILLLEEA